jgi:hypothetical protein
VRSRTRLIVLFLLVAVAACDRTPVDPFDDPDLAALAGTVGRQPSDLTLSGLLYSAIRGVHAEQGMDAARDLVRDLARLQYRIDGAAEADRAELARAMREEQLRIVLLVHGREVIERTLSGVGEQTALLHSREAALAQAGIAAAPEASAILGEVPGMLALARAATDDVQALDAATHAAERSERARELISEATLLPTLDVLYDDAAARLAGGPMQHVAREADMRSAVANAAIRGGSGPDVEAATRAAREARIRAVLSGLGPDAVADVIGWGQNRVRDQETRLRMISRMRDVSRLERMNASAADMLERADLSLRRGESEAALDLAAVAVDVLNALETTLIER